MEQYTWDDTPTTAPAPASSGQYTWDDPAPALPTAEASLPAEPDTFSAATGRGLWSGIASTPEATAGAIDVFEDIAAGDPESSASKAANWLREQAATLKGGAELRSPGALSIRSLQDFKTWAGETLGSAFGSTLAPLAGAVAGGAIGSVAGPGGTTAGILVGQAGINLPIGWGTMRNALVADPDIRDKLSRAEMKRSDLVMPSLVGGTAIGALESVALEKIMSLSGVGKEAVEGAIKQSVLMAVKQGMMAEGFTEFMQQVVQDSATALSGGRADLVETLRDSLNAGIAGALGGGGLAAGFHGAGRIVPASEDKTPGSPEATANQAGGQPTPGSAGQSDDAPPPGSPAGPSPGVSTPGGHGAPPPPPRRSVEPRQGTTEVVTGGIDSTNAAALGMSPTEEDFPEIDAEDLTPEVSQAVRSAYAKPRVASGTASVEVGDVSSDAVAALSPAQPQGSAATPVVEPAPAPVTSPGPVAAQTPAVPQPEVQSHVPTPVPDPVAVLPGGPAVQPAPAPAPAETGQRDLPAAPAAAAPVDPDFQLMELAGAFKAQDPTLSDEMAIELARDELTSVGSELPASSIAGATGASVAPAPLTYSWDEADLGQDVSVARPAARPVVVERVRHRGPAGPREAAAAVSLAANQPTAAPAEATTLDLRGEPVRRGRILSDVTEPTAAPVEAPARDTSGQEAERMGAQKGKSGGALRQESEETAKRWAKANRDADQTARELDELFRQRAEIGRGQGRRAVERAKVTEKIRATQERRAQAAEAAETPAERQERQEGERRAAAEETIGGAVKALKIDMSRYGRPGFKQAIRPQLEAVVHTAQRVHRGALPAQIRRESTGINTALAVLARRALASGGATESFNEVTPEEWVVAHGLQQAGDVDGFWEMVRQDEAMWAGAPDPQEALDRQQEGAGRQGVPDDAAIRASTAEELDAALSEQTPRADGDTLSNAATGYTYTVDKDDRFTIAELVRKTAAVAPKRGGVLGMLDKIVVNRLLRDVGNVRVYAVPQDAVRGLYTGNVEAAGFWAAPSIAERANGAQGTIVISRDMVQDPGFLHLVVKHEAVHALVHYAIDQNLDGTQHILVNLLRHARTLNPNWRQVYGLSNAQEFAAEAMSNPDFQSWMQSQEVPPVLAARIRNLRSTGTPTLWDTFVAQIARLLRLAGFGRQGMTYVEALMRVVDVAAASDQQFEAAFQASVDPEAARMPRSNLRINMARARSLSGLNEPFDAAISVEALRQSAEATLGRADVGGRTGGFFSRARRFGNTVATLGQIALNARRWYGGEQNPIERTIDALMKTGPRARDLQRDGHGFLADWMEGERTRPRQTRAAATIMYGATRYEIDATAPISSKTNKHVAKSGFRWARARAEHARLHAAFNALDLQEQRLIIRARDYFGGLQDRMSTTVVDTILKSIQRESVLDIPAGVTLEDVREWVLDGGIERSGESQQSPTDKAMRQILGPNLIKQFGAATGLRRIRGFYVPLMRFGDYVVTAKARVDVPPDAQLVEGNKLLFSGPNASVKAQAYLGKTNEHVTASSFYVDSQTGERTNSQEPNAEQQILVTVQDRHVEFFDTFREAKAARQRLVQDPQFTAVTSVQPRDAVFQGAMELMPSQVRTLLNSIDQRADLDSGVRELVKQAVGHSALGMMSGNRVQHRRMLRKNVAGFSRDFRRTAATYNFSASNYIARLERSDDLNQGLKEAREYIESHKYDGNQGAGFSRKEIYDEVSTRVGGSYQATGSHWHDSPVQALATLSFMDNLFSFSHSLLNATQVAVVTAPHLAAKYGRQALPAITSAYKAVSPGGLMADGGREFLRAARSLTGRHHLPVPMTTRLKDSVRKERDGAELQAALEYAEERGLLDANAGMEMEIAGADKSSVLRGLDRASRVARAFPQAVEQINRGVTIVAAYRLARAAGRSEEQAQRDAFDAVQLTQGDYSGISAPKYFKGPVGKLALQFKKYPQMMAYLVYAQTYRALRGGTKEERRQALKQLAFITMAHVAFGGLVAAPIEWMKIPLMVAGALGLSDDDWDDWEWELRQKAKQISGSDRISEAVTYGLPRLINVNLSNNINLSSLFTFGQPKSYSAADMWEWIGKSIGGAPLATVTDLYKGINKIVDGNVQEGLEQVIPMKVVTNAMRAYRGAQEGYKDKRGATIVPPLSPSGVAVRAIGFQPGEEANRRQAINQDYSERGKLRAARTDWLNQWAKADTKPERDAVWTQIREWNKSVDRKSRIDMGTLMRSKRERARQQKEREKRIEARV